MDGRTDRIAMAKKEVGESLASGRHRHKRRESVHMYENQSPILQFCSQFCLWTKTVGWNDNRGLQGRNLHDTIV